MRRDESPAAAACASAVQPARSELAVPVRMHAIDLPSKAVNINRSSAAPHHMEAWQTLQSVLETPVNPGVAKTAGARRRARVGPATALLQVRLSGVPRESVCCGSVA